MILDWCQESRGRCVVLPGSFALPSLALLCDADGRFRNGNLAGLLRAMHTSRGNETAF